MKIISPIMCAAGFGPVEFEPRDDHRKDVFAVTVAGEELAELAPLTVRAAEILTDDCPVEPESDCQGSWSLTLIGSGDHDFEAYLLCPADNGLHGPELTGELAVWATLAVIWAREEAVIGRG